MRQDQQLSSCVTAVVGLHSEIASPGWLLTDCLFVVWGYRRSTHARKFDFLILPDHRMPDSRWLVNCYCTTGMLVLAGGTSMAVVRYGYSAAHGRYSPCDDFTVYLLLV